MMFPIVTPKPYFIILQDLDGNTGRPYFDASMSATDGINPADKLPEKSRILDSFEEMDNCQLVTEFCPKLLK